MCLSKTFLQSSPTLFLFALADLSLSLSLNTAFSRRPAFQTLFTDDDDDYDDDDDDDEMVFCGCYLMKLPSEDL